MARQRKSEGTQLRVVKPEDALAVAIAVDAVPVDRHEAVANALEPVVSKAIRVLDKALDDALAQEAITPAQAQNLGIVAGIVIDKYMALKPPTNGGRFAADGVDADAVADRILERTKVQPALRPGA